MKEERKTHKSPACCAQLYIIQDSIRKKKVILRTLSKPAKLAVKNSVIFMIPSALLLPNCSDAFFQKINGFFQKKRAYFRRN
jgi:hypothetical protein